ncbi:hypothetical protein CPB83DRAFT_848238 [Crepidotus variabilis]|uniref:Uncharacterized protein n=1 Tax=Crepidotus variabilis TaxID=179855 RepID=A0A9P6JTR5_9AGAR|nr:hypothetical protein CPB83DRAFT_848238 [Crepidotus variabilis]
MSSSSSTRQRAPSLPSTASVANGSASIRGSLRRPPPPVSKVVTSPPWARDEPPSPKEQPPSSGYINDGFPTETRFSDVASFQSNPSQSASRWWTFTLPRNRTLDRTDSMDHVMPTAPTFSPKAERRSFRDKSLAWIPTTTSLKEAGVLNRRDKEKESSEQPLNSPPPLSLQLPLQPPSASFTIAQTGTPGWNTPWTPQHEAQGPRRRSDSYHFVDEHRASPDSGKDRSPWGRRKKKVRTFILTNIYVPLFFRFINIAFTGAALGISVRIRRIEVQNNLLGAVGSSPTVVIIFASFTLVHVIASIYLEYFGRPLGLWRTSAKLAHTLLETLFICLWSAALSLTFDNFFTSLIPCASPSSTSWYNKLSRPPSNIPSTDGSVGDRICDSQLSLIVLVGLGLIAYCVNLVISLYRIFEKVKYHPLSLPSGLRP